MITHYKHIMNHKDEYKRCFNCDRINNKKRSICWKCGHENFIKLKDIDKFLLVNELVPKEDEEVLV